MTFRESFSSWKRKASAFRNEEVIIYDLLLLQRRMASNAFELYLRLVQFPSSDILQKLFSCGTCQMKTSDGHQRWEAVVMDGTATGILKKFLSFERPTHIMSPMKDVSFMQLILRTEVQRYFLDAIFISAKRHEEKNEFIADYPKSVLRHANELIR